MQYAVNLLKNSPKISDLTKRVVFQLSLREIKSKLGSKWCSADFSSVRNRLARWLLKGDLEEELSGIQVTTLFGVNNNCNT